MYASVVCKTRATKAPWRPPAHPPALASSLTAYEGRDASV